jgi:D-apionolactonase
LRSLRLSHMRVDAWPGEAANSLGLQLETARALGTDVELALHLPVGGGSGLEELVGMLRRGGVRVARVLVFHARELCTSAATIAETRTRLAATLPGVPFYGGTDAWFAQLNIERAGLAQADGLSYSITPQVHAFDEISLVENLAAQADTVATARSFAPGKPIVVSPVTLRPRFNPDTGASAVRHFDTAERADPRQGSLFCAAWTLGSIRYLTAAGADSVTYYEALGPCGVLDGSVFPVFHVFAQLGECRGAAVVPTRSSDPLRAEALVLDDPPHRLAMLASLVPQEQEVVLDGLGAARGHARRISLVTAAEALAEPEAFRKSGSVMSLAGRCLQLGPYEVLILELER